jgi:hypothetical protein
MNYDNLSRIKIWAASLPMTSFAGLPMLLEMTHNSGITKISKNCLIQYTSSLFLLLLPRQRCQNR